MRVRVTKDTVKIIDDNYIINKGEYKVNKCEFEFTEEYTEDLIKKAIFVNGEIKKEMVILNNECEIPQEVLNSNSFELRVYAYEVKENELVLRYSPTYTYAYLREGSYMGGATPSEKITPSQFQQYEKALNDGLQDINDELDLVEEKLVETEALNIEGSKEGHTTTITITGRDGSTNSINIYDGEKGDTGEAGPRGEPGTPGVPGEKGETGYYFTPAVSANGDLSWTNNGDLENPTTVNIKGQKGDIGPTGPAGQDGITPVKGVDYFTSEDIAEIEGDIKEITGDLANLDTTDKTNLVSAINEVASSGGSIDTYVPYISNGSYSTYYLNLTGAQEILKNMINSALPEDKTLITSSVNHFMPTKKVWFTEGPLVHHLEISNSTTYYRVVINLEPTTLNQTAGTYLKYYKWFPYPSYTVYCSIGDDGEVTGVYSDPALTSQGSVRINLGAQALIVNANYGYDALPINNTSSYTPTGDYNPATKKYVDDSIAAAITTTLGGSY